MTIRLEYNQFTTLYADNMYLKRKYDNIRCYINISYNYVISNQF